MPFSLATVVRRMKDNRVVVLLVLALLLALVSPIVTHPRDGAAEEPVVRLSEISGPAIDGGAAMIDLSEACQSLAASVWLWLLFAYAALLVFNLASTFDRADAQRPQWVWESVLTALFLGFWFAWDGCREESWYPLTLLQVGLLTYALYIVLLEKRTSHGKA